MRLNENSKEVRLKGLRKGRTEFTGAMAGVETEDAVKLILVDDFSNSGCRIGKLYKRGSSIIPRGSDATPPDAAEKRSMRRPPAHGLPRLGRLRTFKPAAHQNNHREQAREFQFAIQLLFSCPRAATCPLLGASSRNTPMALRSASVSVATFPSQTLTSAKCGGIRKLRDLVVNLLSRWPTRARVPRKGGVWDNPRT